MRTPKISIRWSSSSSNREWDSSIWVPTSSFSALRESLCSVRGISDLAFVNWNTFLLSHLTSTRADTMSRCRPEFIYQLGFSFLKFPHNGRGVMTGIFNTALLEQMFRRWTQHLCNFYPAVDFICSFIAPSAKENCLSGIVSVCSRSLQLKDSNYIWKKWHL